jgi:hypothetical protein
LIKSIRTILSSYLDLREILKAIRERLNAQHDDRTNLGGADKEYHSYANTVLPRSEGCQ